MDRPKVNAAGQGLRAALGAAFGAAGAAGVLAIGATALDVSALDDVAPAPVADAVVAEAPVAIAAPPDDLRFTAPATQVALGAAPTDELLTVSLTEEALAAPAGSVPRAVLNLHHPRQSLRIASPARAYARGPDNSRLESLAKDLAPDWRAPANGDVSLFVAGDDEAVGWALASGSPGGARVTYQEDRVEVGELSAGVAMTLSDSQLALAYVERDAPAQFGYAPRENMAGLVWTLRR